MGWFIGANSDAHITLINFKNEFLFELYINQIRIFSILLFQKKLFFKTLDSFGNTTFYLAPDRDSKLYIDKIIIDLL